MDPRSTDVFEEFTNSFSPLFAILVPLVLAAVALMKVDSSVPIQQDEVCMSFHSLFSVLLVVWRWLLGLIAGVLIGVGLTRPGGHDLWLHNICCMTGSLIIIAFSAYEFSLFRVVSEEVEDHHTGNVFEDLMSTCFYVNLQEHCVGFFLGLLVACWSQCSALQGLSFASVKRHVRSVLQRYHLAVKWGLVKPERASLPLLHLSDGSGPESVKDFEFTESLECYSVDPRAVWRRFRNYLLLPFSTYHKDCHTEDMMDKMIFDISRTSLVDAVDALLFPVSRLVVRVLPLLTYLAVMVGSLQSSVDVSKSELFFPLSFVFFTAMLMSVIPDKQDDSLQFEDASVKRLQALTHPMQFSADLNDRRVKRRGKRFCKEYREALDRREEVLPAFVARQLVVGVTYPLELNWNVPQAFVSTLFIRCLSRSVAYLQIGSLLLLIFMVNELRGAAGWHLPSSWGGMLVYCVFAAAFLLPGFGARLVLDGMRAYRHELYRKTTATLALCNMMSERHAALWLLPQVRLESHSDVLAWTELNTLVDSSRRGHYMVSEFSLAIALGVSLYLTLSVLFIMVMSRFEPNEVQRHMSLFVELACLFPTFFSEISLVIYSALSLVSARKKRVKVLRNVILRQEVLLGHLVANRPEADLNNDNFLLSLDHEKVRDARDLTRRVLDQWTYMDVRPRVLGVPLDRELLQLLWGSLSVVLFYVLKQLYNVYCPTWIQTDILKIVPAGLVKLLEDFI